MARDFGKYELVERIGTGGMAEVFLAKSFGAEGLEKILVIKRILPEFSENPRFVEMFISEAKIAVDLNHPNIVQIYDFGKHEGTYYIAMEYVEGADLGHLMTAGKKADARFAIGDAVFVAAELAKGLHYAHTKKDRFGVPLNIVHRDISPQNVLVSQDGTVKVVDFGIAKATLVADQQPNTVKGKFAYMSPEQASGDPLDHRSDLFSLGIVLFEMLTGRPLFKASTQDEIMSLVKSAIVPDLKSLNADLPPEIIEVVYKALARNPQDRHEDARALQHELMRVLYSLDEVHDSGTLSAFFGRLEGDIDPEAHQGYAATGSATRIHTSMVRTATGGTMETTHSNTPVTRIMDDSDTGIEIHSRERKEVVIVAGELQGLFDLRASVGQDQWLQVLQAYTRIVDSIAFKSDAVIHRVNEDGFVLLFGIPVSSENDAELAVRVTLSLHEAVAGINHSLEYPIQLSAGIAIGDVILEQEVDKTGRRFSWSFFGSGHELAERLAHAGMAREILAGGKVYRRVRRRYDANTVDRVEHPDDDNADKVQAYLLTGPKSGHDALVELRRSYHTFHGRELPLKLLRETYRQVILEQTGQMLIVTGGQGIGKSTLVEEFLHGLDQRNVRIVRGVVGPHHRDVPLGSMAAFLSDILRLGDLDDLRQVRSTLTTRIKALFPEEDRAEQALILQSLGGIFSIKWPDAAFEEFSGDERRDRIFLSLQKLLLRFAEKKPILLALDDAHHIDTMTLQFITKFFAVTRNAPAMVLFTTDDTGSHIDSAEWEGLRAAKHVVVERLGELGTQESEALILDLLRLHRINDETLVGEILRRAGGNPLYLKEVVEVLRDRGMLKGDTGERRSLKDRDKAPSWLPSSVEGLIGSRIDRLPLRLKVVLQRLAFLWSPFDGGDVTLVLPGEPFDAIEELVSRGLLDREDRADGVQLETFDPNQTPPHQRQYAFCNALTQDVASAGLLPEEAALLHRKLADHLISVSGDTHSTSALIARHFDGAGETDRSVEYYFRAADDALEQYGASESLRLIDKVLRRVKRGETFYFESLNIRARALAELGLKDDCQATYDEIEEIAAERGSPQEQAGILVQQARFAFERSQLKRARDYAQRARQLAGEHDDKANLAGASLVEAMICLNEGNRDNATDLAIRAVATFKEEGGASEGLVRSLNLLGVVHRQAGKHHEALLAYEEALKYAEALDLRKWRRYLLNNAGLALAYLGEFSEALLRYEEALLRVRQLGHRIEEANLLVNIGHCHMLRGEYSQAQSSIRRGIYLSRKTGSTQNLADGLISMGSVHVEQGDNQKAERSLHEGLRLADSIPNVYLSVHATLQLAKVHLAASTHDAARIALMQAEDALERSEQAEMKWGMGYAHSLMGRALKILGKRDKAIEHSNLALEMVDEGEVFALEEILYHHTQILPDEKGYEDDRHQAITRAREVIIHRRDKIKDDEIRKTYLAKPLIRQILSVSKLLLES